MFPERNTAADVLQGRGEIGRARTTFESLRQYAATHEGLGDWLGNLEPRLNAWSTRAEQSLAADERCISTPGCVDKRIAAQVATDACGYMEQRGTIAAAIAQERGNPSGVVDLARLHELGEDLRSVDEQLANAKAEYARLAKKPFTPALCR